MNISKEVRIGVLVLAALVIFFTGFYFLKGADLFSNDKEYYCYFPNVDGLQKSSVIQISGIIVGHVSGMELTAGEKGVKLTLSVNKRIDVLAGTVANLAASDLLGTKVIKLEPGKGPDKLPPHTELPSKSDGGIVDAVSDQLTPRLAELKGTIAAFNKTLANVNSVIGEENQKELSSAIKSLNVSAHNLEAVSSVLGKESGEIKDIIHNTNSITGNLAKNNDTVQRILANVSNVTRQLANSPIQKTLTDLQKTTSQLQGIMDKINNNQGSLGMLINNKDVYNNLNSSIKSLNNLTEDLKAHPSRYINISVFGGKKKN